MFQWAGLLFNKYLHSKCNNQAQTATANLWSKISHGDAVLMKHLSVVLLSQASNK